MNIYYIDDDPEEEEEPQNIFEDILILKAIIKRNESQVKI